MPNLQRGGACLNFAYYSMQLYNPGDPKGGPWHNAPPKYAPGFVSEAFCSLTPLTERKWPCGL